MKKYLLFFLLFLASCLGKLRPDPSPISAYDAGYPTVEFYACDQRFNGVGICPASPNTHMSLLIQGYYKGTIEAVSDRCRVNYKARYDNNTPAVIDIEVKESCNIDIVVTPEYPNEAKSALEIAPLKGRLYIRAFTDALPYKLQSNKVQQGTDEMFDLPDAGRVVFKGCGANFDRTFDRKTFIRLSELVSVTKGDCTFNGVFISGGKSTRLIWQVWIYDQTFTQIPIPSVNIKKTQLVVTADTAVSISAIDQDYIVKNTAKFDFDPKVGHTLRLLTIKGRNLWGYWDPKTQTWGWVK